MVQGLIPQYLDACALCVHGSNWRNWNAIPTEKTDILFLRQRVCNRMAMHDR